MRKNFLLESLKESNEAKELQESEIKIYRKRLDFIVGILLMLVPSFIIFYSKVAWVYKLAIGLVFIGCLLAQNAIIEHYSLKIIRERKK